MSTTMNMNMELDTEAKALYLRLRPGRVADTVELAEMVFMDVDHEQRPLGLEFVDLEAFAAFFEQSREVVVLPPRLAYRSIDRLKEWEVQTGAAEGADQAREIIALTVQFLREIFDASSTLDSIPNESVVVLLPRADPRSFDARVDLAGRIAREGRTVVLRPLGLTIPEASIGRRVS